ncbi:PEP-CTERM sorting domain-containing protein [Pelomonas sp. KK5]|uniref:PEP-CTERM sorting domain-containing protein n=1 Tax=Pelomonas sp. KK5 TaxID=1855730 RepID=UPI00097C1486|nr:PEP-CTERM sorting domain-containing protein [Pelomonas sp. KK5]
MGTSFSPPLARLLAAAALVGLAAGASPASATDFTTYWKEARFDAAVPDASTYTFPTGDGNAEARPYLLGPLGFSTYQHFTHPYLEDDGAYGAGVTYLSMRGIPGVNAAMDTQVDGIYALGFDLGTYDGADTITVTINFGAITVGSFDTIGGAGTSTFFGIVTSDPIQQITFTAKNGTEIDILDFKAGAVSAVPEPASLSFALAGLGMLGVAVRRRKAAQV